MTPHTHYCDTHRGEWPCTSTSCAGVPALQAIRIRKCPACVDQALEDLVHYRALTGHVKREPVRRG